MGCCSECDYGTRQDVREEVRESLNDASEDLAQLLARMSVEKGSPNGKNIWNEVDFDQWWEIVLTDSVRATYRHQAERVIEMLKEEV